MRFKIGDKVIRTNGEKWKDAEYRTITSIVGEFYGLNNNFECWDDKDLGLYREEENEPRVVMYLKNEEKLDIYCNKEQTIEILNSLRDNPSKFLVVGGHAINTDEIIRVESVY